MRTFRVPLWKLLALVALVGVAIAALRKPSDLSAGCVFSLTVSVLLLALVGAIVKQGHEKPPYLGCVLFGWGYLALAFLSGGIRELPTLPTIPLMAWAASKLLPAPDEPFPSIIPPIMPFPGAILEANRIRFEQIGHSLIALLAGLIGSTLARPFRVKYDGTGSPERRGETP